jgi:hypothetical protein
MPEIYFSALKSEKCTYFFVIHVNFLKLFLSLMKQEIYIRNTKCGVACVLNFRLKYTTKELSTKNDKKINYFLELCFIVIC